MKSIWELGINNIISPTITKIIKQTGEMANKFGMAETQLGKHVRETNEHLESQHSILGNLREAAMEFFAVEKFYEIGKDILHTGMQMEVFQAQFKTLTGSTEKGMEAFEKLNGLYKAFPILGKEAIMQAGESLEEVGVPIKNIIYRLKELGSVANGNSGKFVELSSVYEKLVAKGYASTMMFRSQPALLKQIGQMSGYTGKALQKWMNEGNVSIGMFNKALDKATGKGGMFAGALENAAETVAGKWAHMTMTLEGYAERIYEKSKPYIKQLVELGEKYLPKVWNVLKGVIGFVRDYGLAISMAAGAYATYVIWQQRGLVLMGLQKIALIAQNALWVINIALTEGLTGAWVALDLVMDANPIGLIVIALGALAGGILYCWNHFEGFRTTVEGLWETFKVVFTNIKNFVLDTLTPVAQMIAAIQNHDWASAAKFGAQAAWKITSAPMRFVYEGATGGITKGAGAAWANRHDPGKLNNPFAPKGATDGTSELFNNTLAGNPPGGSESDSGSAGGAQGKNITIHFTNNNNFKGQNFKMTAQEMAEHLKHILIATVNDAETAL